MTLRAMGICAAAALAAGTALAQPRPPGTVLSPSRQEVELKASDGGVFLPTEQGLEEGAVVPPELRVPSPAPYPPALRDQGLGGSVALELLVDERGKVAEVTVASAPHPAFAEAAAEAARKLEFQPARRGATPVTVRLRYVYEFVAPPKAPVGGTLAGEVRTKGNRRPIPGAVLLSAEGAALGETDAGGQFQLTLPPGSHRLTVRAPGHLDGVFTEAVVAAERLEVVYRLEPEVVDRYESVVRGSRERTEVSRVTLVDQELTEVPGTQGDPFRVVMLLPGVSSLASGISYPVVRGAQPAATGYFLDGIRVPALFHLLLGPAVIHPLFLARLDFFPGVPPVRYGRLLGGVVEAHTTRPYEERLRASVYADLINAGGFVEYPFTSTGTSFTVAGRYSYTPWLLTLVAKNAQPADPQGYRVQPVADFYDYQARVDQKLPVGRLRLVAFGSSDYVGADNENPEGFDSFVFSRFHRVDLRYERPLLGGDASAGVTWGIEDLGVLGRRGDVLLGDYALRTRNVHARASWAGELSSTLRLAFGADMDHRRSTSTIQSLLAAQNVGSGTSVFRQPLTLGTFIGGYAELTFRPDEAWTVVGGVRADSYYLSPGTHHGVAEPRLTARFAVHPKVTLKAGAGVVHQPPTVLLNLPVVDIAGLRYGLQEMWTGDVGAEWAFAPGLELSVDVYYSRIARSLEMDLEQVFQERRRRGLTGDGLVGHGRAMGLELMLRHPLGNGWFGWISYSLQRSTRYQRWVRFDEQMDPLGEAQGELPFAFDQSHLLNAALSYQLPGGVTLGAVVHFNTGRPESGQISSRTSRSFTDPVSGQSSWRVVNRDEIERLPGFFRVDIRAAKKWAYQDHTVELYLDVLNASLQTEVLGYDYLLEGYDPTLGTWATTPLKRPFGVPIVVPMLGLKGVY